MTPRVLDPFYVEIAMLDATATRALTPDAPAVVSGFDDDFREIVILDQSGSRQSARQEQDPIFLPCQLETEEFSKLQEFASGNSPGTKLVVVIAVKDLASRSLIVPDTGEPLIRTSDRLVSIRDSCMNVIQLIRTPPGLFVTEVMPSFGIARGRDFFLFTFQDREQFARG